MALPMAAPSCDAPGCPALDVSRRLAGLMPRLWQLPPVLAHLLVREILTGSRPACVAARRQTAFAEPPRHLACFEAGSEAPDHLCLLCDAGVRSLARDLLESFVAHGAAVVAIGLDNGRHYMLLPEADQWLRRYAARESFAVPAEVEYLHRAFHYLVNATGFDAVREGAPWCEGAWLYPEAVRLKRFGLTAGRVEQAFALLAAHGGGQFDPAGSAFCPGSFGAFAHALDAGLFRPFVRSCVSHTVAG